MKYAKKPQIVQVGNRDAQKTLNTLYGEWWENEELIKLAETQHSSNLKACDEAINYYHKKDRPLGVLLIHSSKKHPYLSCAHSVSNSEMLLRKGIENLGDNVVVDEIHLREHNISYCNSCVSVASGLCIYPCNCFPFDPMQNLYPKFLKNDVFLFSTPVNQANISDRLQTVCSRLISMDGGFRLEKHEAKDVNFQLKAIEMSRSGNIEYAQRLFGRVCAYFISSKDQNNPADKEFGYVEHVAKTLKKGFEDFGCFHTDEFYVNVSGKWDEDYSYDAMRLNEDKPAQEKAKEIVQKSLDLARDVRENYENYLKKAESGRINRT